MPHAKHEWQARYRQWCVTIHESRGLTDLVMQWLIDNPPPMAWRVDPMEWAFTEMPDPTTLAGRMMMHLGL